MEYYYTINDETDAVKSSMNPSNQDNTNAPGVIVTAGISPNTLGVVRCFGRRGIPVVYIDSEPHSIARYSRYIHRRLACKSIDHPERQLVSILIELGRTVNDKMVIVPTGDKDVLSLSRYRKELAEFYHVPVGSFETVHDLVNKKRFYRLLAEKGIPHPGTYFPEHPDELLSVGREMPYPYILKPADSLSFYKAFGMKNFLIRSVDDLEQAALKLRGKNLDMIVQEIIPGREIYMFYTYFSRNSEPLGLCGYDKIRQYMPDFGFGSFCRSMWRPDAAETPLQLLREIGYHGFAEPELKRDPRDGQYKLLEINARTTLQNRLPAACGVDIEYIAYLDCLGRKPEAAITTPPDGVLWIDDFADQASFLMHLKRRDMDTSEIMLSLKLGKVHSVAAWDDPLPFIVRGAKSSMIGLKRLFKK